MNESKYEEVARNCCDPIGGEYICPQCKAHMTYEAVIKSLKENDGYVYCNECGYSSNFSNSFLDDETEE